MRLRDEPLTPEAEEELEAIDRMLGGEPGEPGELATLLADLRAERPEADEGWRRELDRRIGDVGRSRIASLRGRLRRPSGWLAPAGALATTLLVVAIGVATLTDEGGDQLALEGGGEAPATSEAPPTSGLSAPDGDRATDDAGEAVPPADIETPRRSLDRGDRLAPRRERRVQDRSSSLTLVTDTRKVRELSDEAIAISRSAGGIVVSSQLTEQGERAGADLQLSIPTRELDPTLDRLTGLATVRSFSEASLDITRPFVSARDRLEDARAERRSLLRALGNASTDAEAEAIRRQLRDARREISRAEARFERVARQARLSDVSLRIEGSPGGDDDGEWSLADAAADALAALRTIAGVLLVAAAILVPLVLLGAAAAAIVMLIRRRRRDRTLGD
jgi:hypothetical protein